LRQVLWWSKSTADQKSKIKSKMQKKIKSNMQYWGGHSIGKKDVPFTMGTQGAVLPIRKGQRKKIEIFAIQAC